MWILVAFAFCCANIRLSFVYETAAMNQTTNFCFPRSSGSLFFSGLLNLRGPKPKSKMPYYHFNGKWGHAWQSDLRQRPPNMWGKCFLTLFCFFAPFWNLKVRPIFPQIENMSQKKYTLYYWKVQVVVARRKILVDTVFCFGNKHAKESG